MPYRIAHNRIVECATSPVQGQPSAGWARGTGAPQLPCAGDGAYYWRMSAHAGAESRPGGDTFVLDAQLCFALHDAARAIIGRYRPLLAKIGLTYTQYVVLLVLWQSPTVSLQQLSRAVTMDSATLSPLLKRLAQAGLITRTRRPGDEREVEIQLTAAGMALHEPARHVQAEVERATGLQRADLEALRDQLHTLARQLRSAPGDEAA